MALQESEIWEVDPLRDDRWPEFTGQCAHASVFHRREWLSALHATYGYTPVALTLSAPGEPLANALLLCRVQSWLTGCRLVGLPFSDHCEPLVENPDQLMRLSCYVLGLRSRESLKYVEVRSTNPWFHFSSQFKPLTSDYLHQLDLQPELCALFRGFHKDCIQRKIKKAAGGPLTFESGRSQELVRQLYDLIQLTRNRHKVPTQPFKWFQNVMHFLGNDASVRIASYVNKPVAGILTLRHGKTVTYKYGGSDEGFHNLGAVQMLFWQAIVEAKESGATEFDFGRTDTTNAGLLTFKDRWSAERKVLSRWVSPVTHKGPHVESFKIQLAKEIYARIPAGLQRGVGRILYPHFG